MPTKIHIEAKNNQVIAWALNKAGLTVIQAYALGRRLDGLKHREIAEEMGVSKQTVSEYIKCAIRKLRSQEIQNFNL